MPSPRTPSFLVAAAFAWASIAVSAPGVPTAGDGTSAYRAKGRRAAVPANKRRAKAARSRAKATVARSTPQVAAAEPVVELESVVAPSVLHAAPPSALAMSPRQGPVDTERTFGPAPAPRREPWLQATLSMHMFRRDYGYQGTAPSNLPPYRLGLAPAPAMLFEVWPMGLMRDDALSGLGAFVGYEHALAIASVAQCASGSTCLTARFPTTSTAFQVGPQYRLPLGPVRLGLRAGYGWRAFTISDAAPSERKPMIPSVAYQYMFARGSFRLQLAAFAVDVAGGYRALMEAGELSTVAYFPRMTGSGFEASAGVSMMVAPTEIRVSFDVERHTLAFNPMAGDVITPAGAQDQFMGVRVSGTFGVF